MTRRSVCGTRMIKYIVGKQTSFGAELEAAKALIDEFLNQELVGSKETIKEIRLGSSDPLFCLILLSGLIFCLGRSAQDLFLACAFTPILGILSGGFLLPRTKKIFGDSVPTGPKTRTWTSLSLCPYRPKGARAWTHSIHSIESVPSIAPAT